MPEELREASSGAVPRTDRGPGLMFPRGQFGQFCQDCPPLAPPCAGADGSARWSAGVIGHVRPSVICCGNAGDVSVQSSIGADRMMSSVVPVVPPSSLLGLLIVGVGSRCGALSRALRRRHHPAARVGASIRARVIAACALAHSMPSSATIRPSSVLTNGKAT